jgi:hypothetical protein
MGSIHNFEQAYHALNAALNPAAGVPQVRSREIVALANEALNCASTLEEKAQLGSLLGRISNRIETKESKIFSVFSKSLPELKKIERDILEIQNRQLDQTLNDWIFKKGSEDGSLAIRNIIAGTYFIPAKTHLIATLDLSHTGIDLNNLNDLPDIFGHPGFSQLKSLTLPHEFNNLPNLPAGCELIIKNENTNPMQPPEGRGQGS